MNNSWQIQLDFSCAKLFHMKHVRDNIRWCMANVVLILRYSSDLVTTYIQVNIALQDPQSTYGFSNIMSSHSDDKSKIFSRASRCIVWDKILIFLPTVWTMHFSVLFDVFPFLEPYETPHRPYVVAQSNRKSRKKRETNGQSRLYRKFETSICLAPSWWVERVIVE